MAKEDGKIPLQEFNRQLWKGAVPKNKFDYDGACVLLHRRSRKFVRIAFGDGSNLDHDDLEEKDENGNNIDDYMYLTKYKEMEEDGDGLRCVEDDGGMLLFSHNTYKTGDLRELIAPSLEFLGLPIYPGGYVFISGENLCE